MGVAAAFFRTAAGPVLDHGVHAFRTPAAFSALCCLETVHISAGHIHVKVGVFSEGTVEAGPARLGGKVDLRRQSSGYTEGTVLLGCDPSEFFHKVGVESGSHTKGGGPL